MRLNKLKALVSAFAIVTVVLGTAGCSGAVPNQAITSTAVTTISSTTSTPATNIVQDGVITAGEYKNTQTYDNGNMEVHWSNDGSHVYFAIKAKTAGFVAVGIQPETTMRNADIIFGYVSEGKAQVFDLFSTAAFGPHLPDTDTGGKDDILSFGGKEEDGFTVIEFKRLLGTEDSKDIALAFGSNKIIWAYGSSDSFDIKHSSKGYGQITIQ